MTARLQFEDVRELWGRFYFEVDGFPAPSALSGATVQVGLPPLSVDGKPLQFLYLPGEEGESPRRTPTATPSLPAGVTVGDGSVEVMPYLTMSAAAQAASDGGLLTIELSFRNEDYVALRPNLGPALLVNSDWLYGAYLGREADEPVNWREAAAVWTELATKGVPPLTGGDAEPFVMTVYALAPAGQGPWQDPVLWLPKLDRALQLEVNTKKCVRAKAPVTFSEALDWTLMTRGLVSSALGRVRVRMPSLKEASALSASTGTLRVITRRKGPLARSWTT